MMAKLILKYTYAKQTVIEKGYLDEIMWQSNINFDEVDESTFLREIAWVILSSGMREQVVRNLFYNISKCFFNWESANVIIENEDRCVNGALKFFNSKPKIYAIVNAAQKIDDIGFLEVKKLISESAIDNLRDFSYIGPVTVYHLAKNIGLPVAKPDRHLRRIATMEGYSDVQMFCDDISRMSGDSVPVVDIVLWRFATIENKYLNVLSSLDESSERLKPFHEVPYEAEFIQ